MESDEPRQPGVQRKTGPAQYSQAPVENPAPEEETSEPSSKELTASGDQSGGGQLVSAVLIETTKHVVYKIDKSLITLGASENDDIFVSGFMVGEGHIEIEKKTPNCAFGQINSWGNSRSTAEKRSPMFCAIKTGLKSAPVCFDTWKTTNNFQRFEY